MTFDDEADAIASPCISVCRMDPALGSQAERAAGGLCVGCLRTIDEIIAWGGATAAGKKAIWHDIEVRRATLPDA